MEVKHGENTGSDKQPTTLSVLEDPKVLYKLRGRNHFICHRNVVISGWVHSSAPHHSSWWREEHHRAETVWEFRKAWSFSGTWTSFLESGSRFNFDSYDSKWHYGGWAAEHWAHTMLYLKATGCKKDGNQTRVCWCSPASGSKGYRKRQQGRGLKFLNLPGDYKLISYRPQDWGIRISWPWFSCYLHMEFRVNCFSSPQLPSSRHSDIQPLLGTVWKKAKHYYSTLLLKVGLAYHQLCQNIDRSTIFIHSTLPLHSSHPSAVPAFHAVTSLKIVMACCYSVGQQRLDTNSGLSRATEIPTNKK